jgi:heme/copper-type cytochrome/quinol oxidase subunit 2
MRIIQFFNIAQAQVLGPPAPSRNNTLADYIGNVLIPLVDLLFPIIASLIILAFVWGMVKFIAAAGDEKAIESGKKLMIWGVVIFFILVTFWAIVLFIQDAFGLKGTQIGNQGGNSILVPSLPTERNNVYAPR